MLERNNPIMPSIDRRRFMRCWAALTGAGLLPMALLRGAEVDPEKSAVKLVTPEADRAIASGLEFLASRQNERGDFGSGGYGRNVGVCSLAGMAFLSNGSTPGRGRYGSHVQLCLDFVLEHCHESGYICDANASSHGPMYGHGFATLFLAQTYGMTRSRGVREKLTKAIKLIVTTQNRDGGWRYQPQPRDADISVTVCQIMALRAARNAGLHVPTTTVDRCIEYVKRSQNPDGGFRYMIQGGPSAFPRSAAGLVALYSAGIYDGPEITKGIKYLMQFAPRPERITRESHYFYGQYYAVQAMWHAGEGHWARWYPAIRDELIASQRTGGYWMDSICREYGTAMATIILQIPNNVVPIFQR